MKERIEYLQEKILDFTATKEEIEEYMKLAETKLLEHKIESDDDSGGLVF